LRRKKRRGEGEKSKLKKRLYKKKEKPLTNNLFLERSNKRNAQQSFIVDGNVVITLLLNRNSSRAHNFPISST
jgi:hypothetical protein